MTQILATSSHESLWAFRFGTRPAPTEVLTAVTGAALIGQAVLYRWPTEGWVRGTVARSTRAAGFTHVVRYGRTSALGSVEIPSLLDGASHGPAGRWPGRVCVSLASH